MEINRLILANEIYADSRSTVDDPKPSRRLAVVTCMDARIDVFAALGLHLGDAHVIRNAGGRVTEDVLRSLALSVNVLGVENVVVMGHTGCGLEGVSDAELHEKTGADIEFYPIADHAEALNEDLETIKATPYLHGIKQIAGFVYDVHSAQITTVVRLPA